jgi:6-phosphogluconolactonase (cycloisomerase 2 family)
MPVCYGTAGVNRVGQVLAWRVDEEAAHLLSDVIAGPAELEPCHVAVDPAGKVLAVTNYVSGELALWRISDDGALVDPPTRLSLTGSGPEKSRQDGAHPHQAVFATTGEDLHLYVVDLGADLLRVFEVRTVGNESVTVSQVRSSSVPAGSGPRHMVFLPGERVALSGELGSNLLVGDLANDVWESVPSTRRTGPARTRHDRNYPGDIQRSIDGRYVYFANRGYDTISTFDVTGRHPRLVAEHDSTVRWPQHMLVTEDELLVAGWDSSEIVAMPITGGIPTPPSERIPVPGPGWLLKPWHPAGSQSARNG